MSSVSLRVYESVLDMLSNVDNPTPLVRLNRVTPFQHTVVYAKLEWYNPFGSVKDRVAASLLEDARDRDLISPEQSLVEPTSGNTGLGLTMVANASNVSVSTPVSKQIPLEKRTILRFFGADVLELEDDLCPAPWAPEGAIAKATEIADGPEYHMLNQYGNEANPGAHYSTTGPEIWRQTAGKVTHFVAGLGTCGTISGVGTFLKESDPGIQVLGVHPDEGHDIPGVRSITQLQQTRFFKPETYDGLVEVANQEAYDLCLRLNREESINAGPSSAMALAGAFKLCPDEPGNVVVVIFPDSAFKYASSFIKHLPGLGTAAAGVKSQREQLLDAMVENARFNTDLAVDIDAAHDLWQTRGPFLVDVRGGEEDQSERLDGTAHIPLLDLPEQVGQLPEDRDAPILVFCRRGNLSLVGALFLNSLGYREARSVTGGTNAWRERGFATRAVDAGHDAF